MELQSERIIDQYTTAYQKLYNRTPKGLKAVDDDWVIVNGAQLRVSELEFLTEQLQAEYQLGINQKRNLVHRLVQWFKG